MGVGGYGNESDAWGWLFMIVIMVLVVLGVVLLVRFLIRVESRDGRDENALSILKKRYASGKISRKEFDEIKKEIITK